MNSSGEHSFQIEPFSQIDLCLMRDRQRLRSKLQRAQHLIREGKPANKLLEQTAEEIERSKSIRRDRELARPIPTFPQDLPVVQKREEIAKAIRENQVVVLCGETGSGKTTQLPKICLELGRGIDGMIGHTQPRRIAARAVATRIAAELHTSVGQAVGYKVRFGDKTSENTCIKLMTDGILLAETQGDLLLEAYDTIIIDEAHERSLNIDFLLGYIKQLLPRRPDLKVIITSATIDPERFSKHFNDAPIIEVSGRTYPVEVRYRPLRADNSDEEDREQMQAIVEAVAELSTHSSGDVLVFLSGEREIRETAEELRLHHPAGTDVLPLYARLSGDEQSRIFQPHSKRRIVLATNVAETSLTVPGIKYVIDPGHARISRYSARSKVQRLPIEAISQASADQRKGRCGRVSEGICIRLYSEADYNSRPRYTEPEILRTNLAAVILQMKSLRLGHIDQFPFVEPPDPRLVRDGYITLHELGAVTEEDELTPLGRQLARLPLDPRLGRMILAADREACLHEVLIIASALCVQDPRERPTEKQAVADEAHKQFLDETSDFLSYLKIWEFFREKSKHLSHSQLRKQCKQQFLSYVRLREWKDVHQQLLAVITEMELKPNRKEALPDNVHRALLSGLLSNIGNKTENADYAGPRGSKFFLFPGSALFSKRPQWVMAAELVETTKLYARTVAKIAPEWVEQIGKHLITQTYSEPHWDPQRADVIASQKTSFKGLVIVPNRNVCYGQIDPRISREIFIHHALIEGDFRTKGDFIRHNLKLTAEVKQLEAKARRNDLLADPQQRFMFFHARIPGDVYNGIIFERWRREAERENHRILFMSIADVARETISEVKPSSYPDQLHAGSMKLPLTYVYHHGAASDGVTATIPLALLNQVPATPLDWLIPGLLMEKVVELIRSLPKAIRTKLVPAPDFAARAIAGLPTNAVTFPFLETIATQLGKQIGEVIPVQSFDVKSLPPHLKMNIRVIDREGKTAAMGRDLNALRAQLGIAARESFAALPPAEFTRENITSWDFGNLPESVEIHRDGATYSGFPALVDQGKSVAMKTLDSREASRLATRIGVRRLFMLQLDREMKSLASGLHGIEQMALQFKTLGTWPELRDSLLLAAVDRALFYDGQEIRTRDAFIAKADGGYRRLSTAVHELNEIAKDILTNYHEAAMLLTTKFPPMLAEPIRDIREQLALLLPRNFLSVTPQDRLVHLPRYVKAVAIRLRKLTNAGFVRDQQSHAIVKPLWSDYLARLKAHQHKSLIDPELERYRWMIEELRVSLFAQELKTAEPVSPKRLEKQFTLVSV